MCRVDRFGIAAKSVTGFICRAVERDGKSKRDDQREIVRRRCDRLELGIEFLCNFKNKITAGEREREREVGIT